MPVRTLDLYDLLAPQFSLGFAFPAYIDRYLRVLAVDELQTSYDDEVVLYAGSLVVGGTGEGAATFVHQEPAGTQIGWNGNRFQFRLTVARDASPLLGTALANPAPAGGSTAAQLTSLFQALRPAGEAATAAVAHPTPGTPDTDYPGFAFRLEILLDVLNFSLGDDWVPGRLDPLSHRLLPDTSLAGQRVKIILARATLQYQQSQNLGQPPAFSLGSWGSAGLDTPPDLLAGELARMEPPIALHKGGHFGFSLDQVVADFSRTTTPPEILEKFGTDDDFTGVYARQLLFYYSNDQGVGFNLRVSDALISFAGEVSLEAAADVFFRGPESSIAVESRFYEGMKARDFRHGILTPPPASPDVVSGVPPGQATVAQNAVLQLVISGGVAPFQVQVYRAGEQVWNAANRQVVFAAEGTAPVLIYVVDAAGHRFAEYLSVTVQKTVNATLPGGNGTAATRPPDPRRRPAQLTNLAGDLAPDRTIELADAGTGTVATLRLAGDRDATLVITNGPAPVLSRLLTAGNREVSVDVPHGASYQVQATYAAATSASAAPPQAVYFHLDLPYTPQQQAAHLFDVQNEAATSQDAEFLASYPAVRDYLKSQLASIAAIQADGYASLNDPNTSHDWQLSQNRLDVVKALLAKLGYQGALTGTPHGNTALPDPANPSAGTNRAVLLRLTYKADPARAIAATLARPALEPLPPAPVPAPANPALAPTPAPAPNTMPDALRRLGMRVRLERNRLVVLELSGEIDFETALETRLRNASDQPAGQLQLTNGKGSNLQDGVVEFKVTYSYNTATSEYGIGFVLGAHPGDPDGLLHLDNASGEQSNQFKNIFGALLLFAPILNATATSAATNSQNAGSWVALGASLALPVAIGGSNVFRLRRAVLYGGELLTKFTVPTAAQPHSAEQSLVLDYGVEFDLVLKALGIGLDRDVPNPTAPPLKARYRAIGFRLHEDGGGLHYTPVFDASRGYDLDLSDPSIFKLAGPLGNLLSVAAARLARFNPVTLEVDLALKVDLGVITVDKFKLKVPLAPPGPPMIMPSGVKVNVPGVLKGNGFVNIVNQDLVQADGSTLHAKGVEGGLDLTLNAPKIRVVGSLGVSALQDKASGREGMGVFVGLRVDFPAPLVLGASGLGLYGLAGLFAMNYRRLEDPAGPQDPVGPALHWLVKAEGEPYRLENSAHQALWGPQFDRWSFGVGVVLGTLDAGISANFQGMFILELPGPRILITVKMKFISLRPAGVKDKPEELTTGALGVIDIDLGKQQITVGVLLAYKIEKVLEIQLPIELFFKYDEPSNWHLWLGTQQVPATARILGLVRGSAYFMVQGQDFTYPSTLPYIPEGSPILGRKLDGVAIALGLEAALLFGDEGAGLYLKIGAGFHVGVCFTPFTLVGAMYFSGELRLFVVSIEASGFLDVLIKRQPESAGGGYYVRLHGQVCGSVSFWLFSVSACIDITIEEGTAPPAPAPDLLRGVYLQSNAPVLVSGQGGDRPIDASLGNALPGAVDVPDRAQWVPIDTVPVLQLHYSPGVAGLSTFTAPLGPSPDYRAPGGWVKISDDAYVRYQLTSLTLVEAGGAPYQSTAPVPATWRVERNSSAGTDPANPATPASPTNGTRTNVDLAFFSRSPTPAEHAIERSRELGQAVGNRWNGVCLPAAPPAAVLFTFCGQLLGPALHGWDLAGLAWPDPPGCVRTSPPNTALHVEGFDYGGGTAWDYLTQQANLASPTRARVVGVDTSAGPSLLQLSPKSCINLGEATPASLLRLRRQILVGPPGTLAALPDPLVVPATAGAAGADFAPGLSALVPTAALGAVTAFGVLLSAPVGFFLLQAYRQPSVTVVISAPGAVVTLTAFDNHKKLLGTASQTITPAQAGQPVTLQVSAANVQLLVVGIRNGRGVLTQLCQPLPAAGGACWRALEAPYCNPTPSQYAARLLAQDAPLRDKLKAYQGKTQRPTYVTFGIGQCALVRCFVAIYARQPNVVLVQQLDATGKVLAEQSLQSLQPQPVASPATDLPNTWRDATRPWRGPALGVAQFLFSPRFGAYTKALLEIKPQAACTQLRFVTPCTVPLPQAALYIGALERLQTSEIQQQAEVNAGQQADQDTLNGYLNSDVEIPLLKKDTLYRLTVGYQVTTGQPDAQGNIKATDTQPAQPSPQTYSFRTDDRAPRELRPYVLATSPDLDEKYHFFQDPVRVAFNDMTILKLYQAYDQQLQASIRGADGAPVPGSPDLALNLTKTTGLVLSPYFDAIRQLLQAGKSQPGGSAGAFGCIGPPAASHGLYTPPFALKPLMSYTFDIDPVPVPPLPAPPPPDPDMPQVPPFRRAFTTSRYAHLADFAQAMGALPVGQRALTGPASDLPAPSKLAYSPRLDVAACPDLDLQNALVKVGYKLAPGRAQTGLTLLWVPRPGSVGYRPYAVLLDAAEPTWRLRGEPRLVPMLDGLQQVIDPNFQTWVPGLVLAMELLETPGAPGGSLVQRYVRNTAGTRTLLVLRDDLAPPAAGSKLVVSIRQTGSQLLGLPEKTLPLLTLTLASKAPWEE